MRVAITGGVCDGKTTVLEALREAGYATLSADQVVRELYADSAFLDSLSERLGEAVVEQGIFRRDWVRRRTLEDASFRRRLNRAVHPEVARRMGQRIAAFGSRLVFVEVPLLIEAAMQGMFDRVWVVDAGPKERFRRLVERLSGDEDAAKAVLKTQLCTEVKRAFADRILRTDCPLGTVKIMAADLATELT